MLQIEFAQRTIDKLYRANPESQQLQKQRVFERFFCLWASR
tara:strand:- start:275 stop:397 length:123 start_codon:yes stop_codon:yes gene_type:complete